MFYVQNISIYINFGGYGGGRTNSTIQFLFIIQKNRKSARAWPLLKSNSTSFWFKTFFPRINNKIFMKIVPKRAPLIFLYKVSIEVLIDFIAILLTPGIFLIQIVNTNMYLIQFHSRNIIKMLFPKVGFLKLQTYLNYSLSIKMRWNKLCWHQQRLSNNVTQCDFQKKNVINNYYTYS